MEQVVWVAQVGYSHGQAIIGVYSTLDKGTEAVKTIAKEREHLELGEPETFSEKGVYWDFGICWYQVAKFTVDKDWRQK